jgi:enoyl-CoA hydratase/carnithine racemase
MHCGFDFSSDRWHAGASVTSASLTDGIIASDRASFLTPFTKLCITPEGCSSFWFYELMGKENADRMLVKGEKVQLTPQWHMAALCLLAH